MHKNKSAVRRPLLRVAIVAAIIWFFSGMITGWGNSAAIAVVQWFDKWVATKPTPLRADVEFTYPKAGGQHVDSVTRVCTRVKGLPVDSLRFASKAREDQSGTAQYFPSDDDPHEDLTMGQSVWCIDTLEVGSSADSGKVFDIYALLVGQPDRATLTKYFESSERAGLTKLPAGVKILDTISVIRN